MFNPAKLFQIITGFIILFGYVSKAQTNVSGGIFSDATWTLANSPYIVTDTVVVFPGVALTIEPGVVVKFNDQTRLEIRQASIIAEGTITDSITFTSNSVSPVPGSWIDVSVSTPSSLNLESKFNYCNFYFAQRGIGGDTLTIKNSNFRFNLLGLYAGMGTTIDSSNFIFNVNGLSGGISNYCKIQNNQTGCIQWVRMTNCIIDSNDTGLNLNTGSLFNCEIKYNNNGMLRVMGVGSIRNCFIDSNIVLGVQLGLEEDSLIDCEIKYNGGVGVESEGGPAGPATITGCEIENNQVGIMIEHSTSTNIYCNKICSNTTYDFQYNVVGSNYTIGSNYWCSNDSSTIASHIFDGYDNVAYGLVSFLPLDTLGCYIHTDISEMEKEGSTFTLFPNPATSFISIKSILTKRAVLKIYNTMGIVVYQEKLMGNNDLLIRFSLPAGIYFVQISSESGGLAKKLIIE